MKKLILFLSLLALLPAALRAQESYDFSVPNSDGVAIYYDILTDTESPSVVVTSGGYGSYSGMVVIPFTVTNEDVTYAVAAIGSNAFSGCWNMVSISIPNSVTEIGANAFHGCEKLTSITIPESVTTIGSSAFSQCTSLISITIPNSVTTIGKSAFFETLWLNNQPDGIIYAGQVLHQYKGNMPSNTSVTIREGTVSIGDGAFYGCSGLTSITIPNSVTEIGNEAFNGCVNLKTIDIPESVKRVGSSAFGYCDSLERLIIPASVETIANNFIGYSEEGAVQKLRVIKVLNPDVTVSDANNYNTILHIKSLDTVMLPLQIVDMTYHGSLYGSSIAENISSMTLTGTGDFEHIGWTVIASNKSRLATLDLSGLTSETTPMGALEGMLALRKLTLPQSLRTISFNSFANCRMLESISIPATVEEIGQSAFEDCRSITEIVFEEGSALETIGDWAFYNCHELTSVNLPEGVKSVGKAAFYDCDMLTDIVLPSSLTSIGNNGFALCNRLKQMTVNATTPPAIDSKTFYEVDRSIPVYVPDHSVADYKADPYWAEFNIQGTSDIPTAIDPITTTPAFTIDGSSINFAEETEVSIYTTSGICVYTGTTTTVTLPTDGIYIVKTPAAVTKIAIQK